MAESVVVTGATGLVGSALVRRFAAEGCRVTAAVRDTARAERMFAPLGGVRVVAWDVTSPFPGDAASAAADWFVHAASETSSRAFVERPVETVGSVVAGARNALEFARSARVRSMVFLSTMEVYGVPSAENVTERDYGYLDPLSVRSCYPEAKRLAENLCVSYAAEYGVPVKIARLAQTFGEGVRRDDTRVFAEFARAVAGGRDIVMKTGGETARCYCYIGDAVAAVETILAKGENAAAYSVANEDTFCTVREMAEALVAAHPAAGSRVRFDPAG
ncbi:MAG: NAD-dependent epimerase/dehydratase family protein, partial [Kiritimatiellae bacterium]|nr:NAD-dependent epimerase/dehydratase family protein [Kiritimatiellia bacterium]